MLFSLKSYAKSALQYGEIIFQSKVIPLFLPKYSKLHHSEMYTIIYGIVYCIPYMVETVEKKKKNKTWRNEVDTKTVKIATSEIHISILKRNFTIL